MRVLDFAAYQMSGTAECLLYALFNLSLYGPLHRVSLV